MYLPPPLFYVTLSRSTQSALINSCSSPAKKQEDSSMYRPGNSALFFRRLTTLLFELSYIACRPVRAAGAGAAGAATAAPLFTGTFIIIN